MERRGVKGDPLDQLDPAMAEATRWFVKLHETPGTGRAQAEFDAWRSADPSHAAAYARLQRLWGASGHLPSLAAPPEPDRRLILRSVLAVGGAGLALTGASRAALGPHPLADHATRPGERRTVLLPDASRVELSTATAIDVPFTDRVRCVRLLDGEAWFEVASDRARPFIVETSAGRVTAQGTSFAIAAHAGRPVRVAVTEHTVRVSAGRRIQEVEAGRSLSFSAKGFAAAGELDPATLAWRDGRLAFVSRPLGEVLAALDRWTSGSTIITDAKLAAAPVTLMIATKDAREGVLKLASVTPMRVTRLTPLLTIVRPV